MADAIKSQWEEIAGYPTQTGAAAASDNKSKTELISEALAELTNFGGTTFTSIILNNYIGDILRDIEKVAPVKAKDTENVVTVEGSDIVDMSDIAYLLGVRHIEYPADEDIPRNHFHNFTELEDQTYRMERIDSLPEEDGEEVYVYYNTIHILTDVAAESTLTRQMENVVAKGLKYYALRDYADSFPAEADTAKTKIDRIPKFGSPFGQYMQVGDQKKASNSTVDRAKVAYDEAIESVRARKVYKRYE